MRPRKVSGAVAAAARRTGTKGKQGMDDFKPGPHPRELNNLTAEVDKVERVEWPDEETVFVQLRTSTVPEGFSVPITLTLDPDQWAQLFNLALRKR